MAGKGATVELVLAHKEAKRAFNKARRRRERERWSAVWLEVAKDREDGLLRLWWGESKRMRGGQQRVLDDVYLQGKEGPRRENDGVEGVLQGARERGGWRVEGTTSKCAL